MRKGSSGAFGWASSAILPKLYRFSTCCLRLYLWRSAGVCIFASVSLSTPDNQLAFQMLSRNSNWAQQKHSSPHQQQSWSSRMIGEIAQLGLWEAALLVNISLFSFLIHEGNVSSPGSSSSHAVGMLAAEEGTGCRMLPSHGPSPPTTPLPCAVAADGKCFSQWAKLAPSQGSNSTAVTSIPKIDWSV